VKTKRQKSKDNPNSAYWKHQADAAWGAYVHAQYNRCAVNQDCSGHLEAHHLISRAIRATRHTPENGILLCALHHKWSPHLSPHGAPLQFAEWLRVNLPDKWDWVQRHKIDWKTIKAHYTQAYERLSE
jgi:SAM-dependent methyltransferase